MRKNVLAILLAAMLAISLGLVGCGGGSSAKAKYKDGTYTGTGQGAGGDVTVTLTIASDKITVNSVSGPHETAGIGGREACENGTYAGQINAAQSADIDGVSGATMTSQAVKDAVTDALKQAAA